MGDFIKNHKEFKLIRRRKYEEKIVIAMMIFSTAIVMFSLLSIIGTIVFRGINSLSLEMLTSSTGGGYYLGGKGGILNAIAGSLVLGLGATLVAMVISLPVVFYLNLYRRRNSKIAATIRFVLDLLWGIPSVVYGTFGFTMMLLLRLPTSLLAGIIIVALVIMPIMTRSMDEVLKMVPDELKDAAYSLGATKYETAIKVILRQALPGLVTAILIAFGRGIGDAAAVLFTAGYTDSLPYSLFKPVATLPLAIFFQLGTPFPDVQQRGYASAFVLMILVLAISIIVRLVSRKYSKFMIK
jgi:phosphate transport system permease protein